MKNIRQISVVGAGFMGTQISLQAAAHGIAVQLIDLDEQARERSRQIISDELKRREREQGLSLADSQDTFNRIRYGDALKQIASDIELVVEAIPERLELKRTLFAELDSICARETIFATNSSSIKISAIESATQRLGQVLNLHFYGIIWERPMVELMRGSATSEETVETVYRFAQSIGITPLVVDKESTGFIFNRVWRAVKRETLHLVQEGVTSHEDVDRAWMIFTGMQMGPFALMDRIGLDVILDIEQVYYRESGADRDMPPPLLTDKVERGELGRKSGRGFYTYPNPAFENSEWLKGDA